MVLLARPVPRALVVKGAWVGGTPWPGLLVRVHYICMLQSQWAEGPSKGPGEMLHSLNRLALSSMFP